MKRIPLPKVLKETERDVFKGNVFPTSLPFLDGVRLCQGPRGVGKRREQDKEKGVGNHVPRRDLSLGSLSRGSEEVHNIEGH